MFKHWKISATDCADFTDYMVKDLLGKKSAESEQSVAKNCRCKAEQDVQKPCLNNSPLIALNPCFFIPSPESEFHIPKVI